MTSVTFDLKEVLPTLGRIYKNTIQRVLCDIKSLNTNAAYVLTSYNNKTVIVWVSFERKIKYYNFNFNANFTPSIFKPPLFPNSNSFFNSLSFVLADIILFFIIFIQNHGMIMIMIMIMCRLVYSVMHMIEH